MGKFFISYWDKIENLECYIFENVFTTKNFGIEFCFSGNNVFCFYLGFTASKIISLILSQINC